MLYVVRALCVYTHTHVSDISSLVVVESGLFSVLTMMMYTHPVSSPHSISCLLPLLPVYYGGVAQLTGMTKISEVSILP